MHGADHHSAAAELGAVYAQGSNSCDVEDPPITATTAAGVDIDVTDRAEGHDHSDRQKIGPTSYKEKGSFWLMLSDTQLHHQGDSYGKTSIRDFTMPLSMNPRKLVYFKYMVQHSLMVHNCPGAATSVSQVDSPIAFSTRVTLKRHASAQMTQ